jgi:hypothetical protein
MSAISTKRGLSNFAVSSYVNEQNREMPMYEMTRDLCSYTNQNNRQMTKYSLSAKFRLAIYLVVNPLYLHFKRLTIPKYLFMY